MSAALTPLQYAEQWRVAALNSARDGDFEAEDMCALAYFAISNESRAEPSCGEEQTNA